MNKRKPSLIFCILMDLIGYASYAIPGLGEFADIIWAPISGIIFYVTFGGWRGAFGGLFNFVEELLPGTDFIPSFTIMWFFQYATGKKSNTQVSSLWWIKTGTLKWVTQQAMLWNATDDFQKLFFFIAISYSATQVNKIGKPEFIF